MTKKRQKRPYSKVARETHQQQIRCPACGTTTVTILGHANTLDYEQYIDGELSDRVIWQRCKCGNCDIVFNNRSYRFPGRQAASE